MATEFVCQGKPFSPSMYRFKNSSIPKQISDANISVEEKKDISMKKLRELDDYCTLVVHMRKLIWDIVITEFGD